MSRKIKQHSNISNSIIAGGDIINCTNYAECYEGPPCILYKIEDMWNDMISKLKSLF